ncbi:tyrosine-type recombinase/integrase [Rossellomorea vietnamensis]|uniref:tyrosine-type recombinase/integrase n=1 Tax=Rossellomorea vietnamensis TaxID=218284 RepID=UPI003CF204B3
MELLNLFKEYLESEDKSEKTVKSYIDTLFHFEGWLYEVYSIKDLKIISFREIKNYREFLISKYSPSSVNQKISAIKVFYRCLAIMDILKESPAEKIKLQKIEEHFENQYLTRAQELAILTTAKETDFKTYTLVLLFLKTGLRVSEASNLKLEDLYLEENPTILIKDSKRHKSRYIPISGDVVHALKKWLVIRGDSQKIYHIRSNYVFVSQRAERLSERAIQIILKKIGDKNSIKLYPVRFRASYANNLLQNTGIPINILATLMGHTSISTTQRYAAPSMDDKRKYINKLSEI